MNAAKIAALVVGIASLAACQRAIPKEDAASDSAYPQRIVTLTPALTEMVFALGAGDLVIGNTLYCDYPEAATTKAKVGGAVMNSLDIERLLALKPDLVLLSSLGQEEIVKRLVELGVNAKFFPTVGVGDVFTTLTAVGSLLGRSDEADDIVATNRRLFAEVESRLAGRPRPRVFHFIWHTPLMTAGPSSFLGQLLAAGGGDNIFSELAADYPQVSHEDVVSRNPQVVLGPQYEFRALTPESLDSMPGWRTIDAVRQQRVRLLDDQIVSRPGPRIGLAVVLIAQALHPDVDFSDLETIGRTILPPSSTSP